jgi:hypothetical protein
MGFSSSIGGYFCSLAITAWLFVWLTAKVITTIDDDGKIKTTANERLAAWIKRWFE